ncbi:thiamine pyrophosphate-dependent enzyme [Taibaiella soli]|uniref:Ubiquinone-dependent pyruvate dehydrogenase n=1 Tax=Taibaiella soli TaxID=1649169 RepID=A0A2W2AC36_9BACT|nr:thiamine pyrophosphate-dependent enzyme [Taibaiella soli]PZF71182.1 ubiquinone-dependent pyruvate dehydrogenase [Taibaiella soli]
MSQNVADQIVTMLVAAGVKRIYAVTGDSLNHLNDAVRRNGQIKWMHVRHEEAGAYAAAAEAELEGIGCCAGSAGPGHVHLINGLYDAHRSNVPVIAIAATINTNEMGTEYFQGTNTIKLFDDCSLYNQLITTPVQAPHMLQTALQHAIHRKGVAVIGLPGDVSAQKAQETETSLHTYRTNSILRPAAQELKDLAGFLNETKKIVIYTGIGAADAHNEVVALAQKLNAPVGYSFRGKMSMQYDNPNEIGMTGLLGLPSAYHAMHEADLLLLLGTDFPYSQFMPTDNKIIQIDECPEKLGRRAKLYMGLHGNVKDTLEALLPMIDQKSDDDFLQTELKIYGMINDRLQTFAKESGETDKIEPEHVAAVINEMASSDAIFTLDTGMCCVWGARYLHATGFRKTLGSFNHGSMANAMPMAIGAQAAYPGRQVIAFCGDGGISMLLGDLATIQQYRLPVKLIVFNNRALGMVKLEMEVQGLPDNETDMVNPDFALVAQAMGFTGINVHEPSELRPALETAFNSDGPVLVNIFTNADSLAMPPKLEWEQAKGFAMSMTKMMLTGRMDEVMNIIRTNYKHIREVL